MTTNEFEFWQKAYLAALTGLAARTDLFGPGHAAGVDSLAREMADAATRPTDTAVAASPRQPA